MGRYYWYYLLGICISQISYLDIWELKMNETEKLILNMTIDASNSCIALLHEIITVNVIARSALFLVYTFGIQILHQQMVIGDYISATISAVTLLVSVGTFWALYRICKGYAASLKQIERDLLELPSEVILTAEAIKEFTNE
jgi:hypothetical protein